MTLERRIRSDIEARIQSGEWPPGHRIPFEHELVVEYGCARATIGKALGELARVGLIERRRRAGSFVARPKVHSAVLEVPDFAAMIAARGERYGWTRHARRPAVAADLVPTDGIAAPALLVEGVHAANDIPFCFETRIIALAAVPEARDEAFLSVSPGQWLLTHVPWTRARHTIRAVRPERVEAARLGIAAGAPCLSIDRRTWRLDQPVTWVRQVFPGDRFDLSADFDPASAR